MRVLYGMRSVSLIRFDYGTVTLGSVILVWTLRSIRILIGDFRHLLSGNWIVPAEYILPPFRILKGLWLCDNSILTFSYLIRLRQRLCNCI